jgi:hypothetical protein
VTIPNGIKPEFRRNLRELERAGFKQLILNVTRDLSARLKMAKGAKPWMIVDQKHYPSQRSFPITDARLEFDPRTAFPRKNRGVGMDRSVKSQPEWLDAVYRALLTKRCNLQMEVGAIFPYTCEVLSSPAALDHIAAIWVACKPVLKAVLGDRFGTDA